MFQVPILHIPNTYNFITRCMSLLKLPSNLILFQVSFNQDMCIIFLLIANINFINLSLWPNSKLPRIIQMRNTLHGWKNSNSNLYCLENNESKSNESIKVIYMWSGPQQKVNRYWWYQFARRQPKMKKTKYPNSSYLNLKMQSVLSGY